MELPSGVRPIRVYAMVNLADSAAIARSVLQTRLKPAPAAVPFTAAITGARIRASREMPAWR